MNIGEGVKLTPMMEQWWQAKSQHQDAILLFRMGDFYELFGEDAIRAAPILELALTSRDKDKAGLKMAGFPFHAADSYIAKLVERGHKVAICDQLEDPKFSRGVVKRGITNVVTPGTAIESESSSTSEQAFLVGIVSDDNVLALCALELATATFLVTSSLFKEKIIDEAVRLAPKELVILSSDTQAVEISEALVKPLKPLQALRVEKKERLAQNIVKDQTFFYGTLSRAEKQAASLVLSYVLELKGALPAHVGKPKRYSIEDQLLMDDATRVNLDLVPKRKGDRHNLFAVLDETKTAMGRRALYQNIKAPSTSQPDIENRHNIVEALLDDDHLRTHVREILTTCYDLEKLTALAASNKIGPRGMGRLRDCLMSVDQIVSAVNASRSKAVKHLLAAMPDASSLRQALAQALVDEPPLNIRDGGIFRAGYDHELDEFKDLMQNGQQLLLDLEIREREETRISSLKVKYTRVFGYYVEVTKTHLDKVPAHYQRKQTVANGERYITTELSELEIKLNMAEERALAIELNKFDELRQKVTEQACALMEIGRTIAHLDLLASFAELASVRALKRPKMMAARERVIDIRAGRHPVVEDICRKDGVYFVPNDVLLDSACSLALITGPNMAGKSTIMRQVALIQIMAQIGSFVPACSATLSICDAIFARVGASDDLATGRSTFMVEMSETAAILSNASLNSLILLDEIGRGTSTYDGLSIAQAVAEYIHDELQTRTLFATHYHELTDLEERLPRCKNFHVEVEEKPDLVRFLYTLGRGPCLKSFGIQVARLSGLPNSVLNRAREVLVGLEAKHASVSSNEEICSPMLIAEPKNERAPQLDLFANKVRDLHHDHIEVIEKILRLDVNRMTPLQALNRLASWQTALRASATG